jgi:DNA-binding NarL/FixJ family response regulator
MNQYLKGAKIVELIEDACDAYHSEVNESIGYVKRAVFEDGSWIGSITKADAEANWALVVASVFQYRPPRLELAQSHREILRPALEGMTDEEIAATLFLSLSAVKKRWSAIYDHVSAKGVAAGLPPCEGKRGPERRRVLLEYLRWHPEELNPLASH